MRSKTDPNFARGGDGCLVEVLQRLETNNIFTTIYNKIIDTKKINTEYEALTVIHKEMYYNGGAKLS